MAKRISTTTPQRSFTRSSAERSEKTVREHVASSRALREFAQRERAKMRAIRF